MLPELANHTEKLVYFFEIAQEGSYRATARKLGVSAPTVSYAIKQLESVLGVPLFVRGRRGAELTPAGETLHTFCRGFYRDMEIAQRQIRAPAKKTLMRVRVGTFQSIAIYFWPTLVDILGKDDPSLSISIKTGRSRALLELLVKREIDLALTVGELRHEGICGHALYQDFFGFYCSSNWPSYHLKRDQIIDHPLLFIPDATDDAQRTLRQHVYASGLFFRDDFEFDSFEVIGEFVKRGYGVGILPTKVAATYGGALAPLTIDGVPNAPFGQHSFFLSYREDLDLPARLMKSFIAAAHSAVRLQSEAA